MWRLNIGLKAKERTLEIICYSCFMMCFGAQDPKHYFQLLYIFELLPNMFFDGKNGVGGRANCMLLIQTNFILQVMNLSTRVLGFIHRLIISLFWVKPAFQIYLLIMYGITRDSDSILVAPSLHILRQVTEHSQSQHAHQKQRELLYPQDHFHFLRIQDVSGKMIWTDRISTSKHSINYWFVFF